MVVISGRRRKKEASKGWKKEKKNLTYSQKLLRTIMRKHSEKVELFKHN